MVKVKLWFPGTWGEGRWIVTVQWIGSFSFAIIKSAGDCLHISVNIYITTKLYTENG